MPSKHHRYRYNHMLPHDQEIWNRFLEQYGDYFDRFVYDIHVGEGVGRLPQYPENIQRMALLLSQKRIDAVGYHGEEVWLFEIKPRAGLSAVGQVRAYRILFEHDYRPLKVYRIAIVTNKASYDMARICEGEGIRLYEVG